MNWFIILPVGAVLITLVIFLVVRNQKDEKEFESQMNNDYHKSKEDDDIDVEEVLK